MAESMLKKSISDPYDFQHLTHTSEQHAKALQTATKRSHNELVSEFSAMRASQAARKELKGIRAENIVGGRSLSRQNSVIQRTDIQIAYRTAPSTPPSESEFNTSPKSREVTRCSPANRKGLRISQSVDNFSRINPRSFSSPSPPQSPPPRRSSRSAINLPLDAIGKTLSPSKSTPAMFRDGLVFPQNDVLRHTTVESCMSMLAQHDPYSVGNAVSTPDNTAYTLRPQLSSTSITLADVPEEEEAGASARQSIQSLGLTIPSSHKHRRASTMFNLTSNAPQKLKEEPDLIAQVPHPEADGPDTLTSASEVQGTRSTGTQADIGTQTDTGLTAYFTDSWEDDIDYCYEHAAEADCAFDWDRVSCDDERDALALDQVIDEIIDSAASSFHQPEDEVGYTTSPVTGSQLDLLQAADPQPYLYTYLDPSHIKTPSQICFPLSATSSSVFASEAPTPSEATSSPNFSRYSRRYERESGIFPVSPSLLTLQDYEHRIIEAPSYSSKGLGEGREALDSAANLPLYELRFPPGSISGEESICSSVNHLSKCSSRDSLPNSMRPRSNESLYGNTSSIGSLPELVHSKRSIGRKPLAEEDLSTKLAKASISVGMAEAPCTTAASIPENEPVLSPSLASEAQPVGHKRSLSEFPERILSPSVAELEKLAKGSSSGSTTPSTASNTFAGRMRSATVATTASGIGKKSRASYSLFPSVPVPASR